MKRKITITEDEKSLFRDVTKGIKPLGNDKVSHPRPKKTNITNEKAPASSGSPDSALFYFSDLYQPKLPDEGPVRYLSDDGDPYILKQLKRGDFHPEMMLDLHGLTQQQAKLELAALINESLRTQCRCVSVMTGIGAHILKERVPAWLAQHPSVEAFHQAPRNWGGRSALLVLIKIVEKEEILQKR